MLETIDEAYPFWYVYPRMITTLVFLFIAAFGFALIQNKKKLGLSVFITGIIGYFFELNQILRNPLLVYEIPSIDTHQNGIPMYAIAEFQILRFFNSPFYERLDMVGLVAFALCVLFLFTQKISLKSLRNTGIFTSIILIAFELGVNKYQNWTITHQLTNFLGSLPITNIELLDIASITLLFLLIPTLAFSK